jgi:hypothetical protein
LAGSSLVASASSLSASDVRFWRTMPSPSRDEAPRHPARARSPNAARTPLRLYAAGAIQVREIRVRGHERRILADRLAKLGDRRLRVTARG